MSVIIDLPRPIEARIEQEAQKAGVTTAELISRTLTERFPSEPDENAQALALIDQWLAEAPSDPEDIAAAEEDLRTFQRALNDTRREAGSLPTYPEAE